jgi:RNA polymerase sigma-70 factor (ECF subfamily)
VDERARLTGRFEEHRRRLLAVAYRMLGSLGEAEDAVQEAWLRLDRSDAGAIDNLPGWLTTVVARVCLDMLKARRVRAEPEVLARLPDPVIAASPEHDVLLADSISLALLVVLETLAPAERLAFVLHDMFDVPFDEIAPIVGKTPAAARQMVSRARRRVQGVSSPPDADLAAQQEVVAAFLAAARGGDLEALLRVLDPDVVVRGDQGTTSTLVRGAADAARGAIHGARLTATARIVLVNGAPGIVSYDAAGEPHAVVALTVRGGKIVEIDVLADPDRLRRLGLA